MDCARMRCDDDVVAPFVAGHRDQCPKARGEVAIEACTRAINSGDYRGGDLARLYFIRGNQYQRMGDTKRAITDFDDWVRLSADKAEALHSRGEWYTQMYGWYDLALADLNVSLRLRPNDAATLDGRGRVYMFTKQYDKAMRDLDAAFRLAGITSALYALGWAKLQIGDISGGNRDIARAKVLTPDVERYGVAYGIPR
jgi:tetratricopeptide (TPR) repeat protein